MRRVSLSRPSVSEVRPLDPELLVTTLAARGVSYVLIGAMAARLQGFARMTADADITPARDAANLELLAGRVWRTSSARRMPPTVRKTARMRLSFARCCGDANIGLAESSADEQQQFVGDGGIYCRPVVTVWRVTTVRRSVCVFVATAAFHVGI